MPEPNTNARMINILQLDLLNWFSASKRDLPFRRTKDPYAIWISEIMAQQTQIDTLIPYYQRFIARFPDVIALAEASEDAVIKAWEGLGYYSRARNLHQAAKMIVSDFNGHFPERYEQLLKLPGIGPYTGGAIASIAFNQKVSAVDGNVLRVISRYCNSFADIGTAKTRNSITQWVESILPAAAGDFNEALMELGALICTPQNPKCLLCPIRTGCQGFAAGTSDQLPVKKKKPKQRTQKMEVGIVRQNGAFFFIRRPDTGLLSGLWSFPIVETVSGNGQDIQKELAAAFPGLSEPVLIGTSRHVFSHVIWEMSVYGFELPGLVGEPAAPPYAQNPLAAAETLGNRTQFKPLAEVDTLALPIAFSKLLPLLADF
jgi:A/G-specific adenine glycosylase